jgi:mycofactocin biosynthesis protein MftB
MATPAMVDEAWALSGSVALRPEPFGALAYHFGTRQLSFLKTPQLVTVVRTLGSSSTVGGALTEAGVEREQWPSYLEALGGLADSGMLVRQGEAR